MKHSEISGDHKVQPWGAQSLRPEGKGAAPPSLY